MVGLIQKDPFKLTLNVIRIVLVLIGLLAGLPALSMPTGLSGGRPLGLQLIGPHFAESRLLNVAHRFQQATDWHRQVAPAIEGGLD